MDSFWRALIYPHEQFHSRTTAFDKLRHDAHLVEATLHPALLIEPGDQPNPLMNGG
jgi:hypothetical protein